MEKTRNNIHFRIYFALLLVMAVSLPLSKALMSITPGFMVVNWLVEGQFRIKFKRLKERKSLMLIISVFLVYLVGLLWTNNMQWALHDVKIQLPLLVLPLVIGTSADLNYAQLKRIIYLFSIAVVVSSFCSIWVLLGFSGKVIRDLREISLFISHIRFALLINISIFSLGWYFANSEKKSYPERIFLIMTIIWLAVFLLILKSITGWVVFMIVATFAAFLKLLQIKKRMYRLVLLALLLSGLLLPAAYIGYVVKEFYRVEELPEDLLHAKTSKGNLYVHDLNNKEMENGHFTFLFINEDELGEAWNARSRVKFDSITPGGFNRYVLFRYLTSKGLRKDAEGVSKLSEADISNIENGISNYRFTDPRAFSKRIYQIVWEIDVYLKGGDPSGHSVTQRFEYYKMAFRIIQENFWFGTGTGGYYMAYQEKYDQNKFFSNQKFRQRSHNMFLSYCIDFGVIGLIYICFALFAPVFLERKTNSFLLMVFLLIVVLSFMNEDSLNNHDAISFFSFLYPLYLYGLIPNPSPKEKGAGIA